MPNSIYGRPRFPLSWHELNWLEELPKNTYFAIGANLPSSEESPVHLPQGHPLYVITFHQERFDYDWVVKQAKNVNAPVIVLNDGSVYDFPLPSNVHFYTYHSWHHHTDMIMKMFPNRQERKDIRFKVSNICNRITQSKLIVFTALMEYLPRNEILVKLGDWIQDKNVHYWQNTGNEILDNLTSVFRNKYIGTTIEIDNFDNSRDNFQTTTSNPWQPTLINSALHFVSESYHYSLMDNEYGRVIMPGPAFSEKIFKCLVAGAPFIPVGQFECYKHLEDLGLIFDYGDLDLGWDKDPGNFARLENLVGLRRSLQNYSFDDIVNMTKSSTEYNTDYIWSGKFRERCETNNQNTADLILKLFK